MEWEGPVTGERLSLKSSRQYNGHSVLSHIKSGRLRDQPVDSPARVTQY